MFCSKIIFYGCTAGGLLKYKLILSDIKPICNRARGVLRGLALGAAPRGSCWARGTMPPLAALLLRTPALSLYSLS